MIGILSIDFDYFIDASSEERDMLFPQGADEIPPEQLMSSWNEMYIKYPEMKKLGVIRDFYIMKDFLSSLHISKKNFVKADSHKYIKRMIYTIPVSLQLRIVNIDFHHDYYHYYTGNDSCNCGNWLRKLVEERPNTMVKWIRRTDSQTVCLDGEIPFEHTDDIKSIFKEKFDYVFMCRSPEWSPPHLTDKYNELASIFESGR